MVEVSYSYRDGNGGLVDETESLQDPRALDALFARYPWDREAEPLGQEEAGGGLFFRCGDATRYASYQFVPLEADRGWLYLEIVANPGFLKLFGRRATRLDFDVVPRAEAQHRIRELFDYDIDRLYTLYRKGSRRNGR